MYSLRPVTVARPLAAAASNITARKAPSMIIPASQRLQQQLQRRNMATIQPTRISDRIKKDHEELASYVNTIKNSSDYDTQVRYQNQFIWELARHSIAEEIVVYPAFEQHVLGGKEMADKDRKEHLEVCPNHRYPFPKITAF